MFPSFSDLSDLEALDRMFFKLPVPQPADELRAWAKSMLPFAGRVLPWADTIIGMPSDEMPPVFVTEPRYFALQGLPSTAGWFAPAYDQIVIAAPVDDTFKRSVVLHETIHWLQFHTYPDMDWHQAEFEAYKTQMAWLATQGFDVRNEGKFFSPGNLLGFTHTAHLYWNDYAWLEPWEKEGEANAIRQIMKEEDHS